MRVLVYIAVVISVSACSSKIPYMEERQAQPSSFNTVWEKLASEPLEALPHKKVKYSKLQSKGENIILNDSVRTLTDHRDIIEPFEKLAHPNGICFKGTWEIDKENIYSGYFKKGSKALIIARASSAMSHTTKGEIRSFGFAGKLFPTNNGDKVISQNRANFFLIDDLGGTKSSHYTDVRMTNEPSLSFNREVLKHLAYVAKISKTFSDVDKNPGIRQLYEISELAETGEQKIITPKWMKLQAKNILKSDANDFRDALKINTNEEIVFSVSVASEKENGTQKWREIGSIVLEASVVSEVCDRQLHFHHPKWRDDLEYKLH